MGEENLSPELWLKNIDETRNYFLEDIKQNELMNRKHKKVCTTLNYIEHLIILPSAVTGSVSNFAFASLVCVPIAIASFVVRTKNCAITAGIKTYNRKI